MKKTLALMTLVLSNMAFAGIEGNYKNTGKVSEICPDTLSIIREGRDLRITNNEKYTDLGLASFLNTNGESEELIVTNINKGEEKVKSKNSSHGQTIVTRRTSKETPNSLSIVTSSVESLILFPLNKAIAYLDLKKSGSLLGLEFSSEWKETGSTGQAPVVTKCTYKQK